MSQQQDLEAFLPYDLLELPYDLLSQHILQWLSPPELARFGCCSTTTAHLAHAPRLWQSLCDSIWYDAVIDEPSQDFKAMFVNLAYRRFSASRGCPMKTSGCRGFLRVGSRRCPCVGSRGVSERGCALPLAIGGLAADRSDSTHMGSGDFSEMLELVNQGFILTTKELTIINDASLAPLDVLMLYTADGAALTATESASLQLWVQQGGALLVSAHWSRDVSVSQRAVGWLGIKTKFRYSDPIPSRNVANVIHPWPRLALASDSFEDAVADITNIFEGAGLGQVYPEELQQVCKAVAQRPKVELLQVDADNMARTITTEHLINGPFGQVDAHHSVGASEFELTLDAITANVVALTKTATGHPNTTCLAFFPPQQYGPTGAGRVLVTPNFLWFTNGDAWRRKANRRLLLNFICGAVAARRDLNWSGKAICPPEARE
mmetsp:Transcript_32079/g.53016  ORF Transcript_32079/g.53016 Transcript_32079/m.53016 type:complete len:434 (-) Transcript_32079:451-1752(-)|eukprot:CAMPEP_0119314248 /NCGR_PEP_ID=MMETSP1333-20130426/32178_1 /TAXON_ID=418940 /ORGANISM="Scyphosphaera apsteinii, Strain RCC1455" /LENGTH=433 /DNA_ID=CAMNT_0007319323 /DNA_START=225 /DNA_END=1526 /DNA_ORIENTATION=-